ncbi:putative O-glycosylation ligase, exosortase A system-associated [Methylococcus sp. EFPC2]|uniref:putative O-glycosylation ligase, exosortase A system-associated n=1 Tax=Methylococcus sp. EFPC2 TaxID=2812648 RepID=UPI0019673B0D|nr:putative O-glycosylation ligase, exosortase A system-associated [Methylococcus sp. EFPC2]QSA98575.1 putative O-glycosylation ligase, exosortase A system-associated [Methylococcus sp. EFPC2]
MRDIFVSVIVFGLLPRIVFRPDIGILLWCWLSYMNPHKLSWGFAHDFPFAMLVALAILGGLLIWKEPKKIPWSPVTVILVIFVVWMFVTTVFAVNTGSAWAQWNKVWKIQLMTVVTMMVMNTRWRLETMLWVIALSLGFYGVKGGIFTVLTGGGYRVWGPGGSFIAGNNEIGLALIMTIPLLRYIQLTARRLWIRHGMTAAMVLSMFSIIGTQSRGAFLGMGAMSLFLAVKSRNKVLLILLLLIAIPAIVSFMPDSWHERMSTINTYQKDESALGRINAWWMAFNSAKVRPFGGGFECFLDRVFFATYAPIPWDVHDAHSIYFEVLGEHGFIGLGLFLSFGLAAWHMGSSIIRDAKKQDSMRWMSDMAAMIQVSLVGYAASGTFLGLAYFDLMYNLVAILVVLRTLADKQLAEPAMATETEVIQTRPVSFVRPVIPRQT